METNNGKDDLKTNFVTREGVYRLLNLSEYSRPNRVGYQSNQNSPQVRVSLVSLPQNSAGTTQNYSSTTQQQQQLEKGESGELFSFFLFLLFTYLVKEIIIQSSFLELIILFYGIRTQRFALEYRVHFCS
jgi:hypothetical protein